MSDIRHSRVFPTNTKVNYTSLNNVDFELNFPNRKLVANSIRIEGNIRCNSSGTTQVVATDEIYFDNYVGANALISDIQTVTANQGSIELITELPRYTKMISSAFSSEDDFNNISNLCELKCQNLSIAKQVLLGNNNENKAVADPNVNEPISFSIKPNFCLNQASNLSGGNVNISSRTTGDLRVSIRLSRNEAVFFGNTTEANYQISNLSLVYLTVPEDNKQEQITLRTKVNISQSIQSTFSNISVNVPSRANGVSISFLRQDKENNYLYNNTQCDKLPNVDNVEFLFNDSTNKYITFKLDTQEMILNNYEQSITSSSDSNLMTLDRLKASDAYGVGVNFNQLLDLSANRFGLNVASAVTNNAPYLAYMFFHGFTLIG